jgi:hypothetical protein
MTDTIVHAAKEDCLEEIEAHFLHEWPYPGRVKRHPSQVVFTERMGLIKEFLTPIEPKGVSATVTRDAENRSRVTIEAGRDKYGEALTEFVGSELETRTAKIHH